MTFPETFKLWSRKLGQITFSLPLLHLTWVSTTRRLLRDLQEATLGTQNLEFMFILAINCLLVCFHVNAQDWETDLLGYWTIYALSFWTVNLQESFRQKNNGDWGHISTQNTVPGYITILSWRSLRKRMRSRMFTLTSLPSHPSPLNQVIKHSGERYHPWTRRKQDILLPESEIWGQEICINKCFSS